MEPNTIDGEALKKEIRELTALGKEALKKHEIGKAFDFLLIVANIDEEAKNLFVMIPNTHTRMYLLSKEQIEKAKELADKGYPLAEYAYGRYLMLRQPDDDAIEGAIKYLKSAAQHGVADAQCALAYLLRDGHYGVVDRDLYIRMVDQAYENHSTLAERKVCLRHIFGQDGYKADPQHVIDDAQKRLKDGEPEDLSVINPIFYNSLGDAYAEKGDAENAEKYYTKAIRMGFIEAYSKVCTLYMEDKAHMETYLDLLDQGCSEGDPDCYTYRAAFYMDHYDSFNEETKKKITKDIKADLNEAFKLGQDMAPYFLGNAYHDGSYGFEEDLIEAWNWFIEGAHREDYFAFSMLAQMIEEGNGPDDVKNGFKEFCQLNALRRGDNNQLRNVVEAYHCGRLDFAAEEIEKYYIPQYESLPPEEDEEDEEDDEEDDAPLYQLIAIIKTNGKADIHEFNMEYWEELAPMIDANRLDAIRTQPLYDLSEEMGYTTTHITAWVDNMGLLKDLPMNPVGCRLYPGPIAGDMILTLEDNKYNPLSFGYLDELKKIIDKLGATLENIDLDEGPDDDGRYDAWS